MNRTVPSTPGRSLDHSSSVWISRMRSPTRVVIVDHSSRVGDGQSGCCRPRSASTFPPRWRHDPDLGVEVRADAGQVVVGGHSLVVPHRDLVAGRDYRHRLDDPSYIACAALGAGGVSAQRSTSLIAASWSSPVSSTYLFACFAARSIGRRAGRHEPSSPNSGQAQCLMWTIRCGLWGRCQVKPACAATAAAACTAARSARPPAHASPSGAGVAALPRQGCPATRAPACEPAVFVQHSVSPGSPDG